MKKSEKQSKFHWEKSLAYLELCANIIFMSLIFLASYKQFDTLITSLIPPPTSGRNMRSYGVTTLVEETSCTCTGLRLLLTHRTATTVPTTVTATATVTKMIVLFHRNPAVTTTNMVVVSLLVEVLDVLVLMVVLVALATG